MARPTTRPSKRSQVSLRLDRAQRAQLETLARVHGCTPHELAARAFQGGLETYPQKAGHSRASTLTQTDHGLVLTLRGFKPEHARLLHKLISIWETEA